MYVLWFRISEWEHQIRYTSEWQVPYLQNGGNHAILKHEINNVCKVI